MESLLRRVGRLAVRRLPKTRFGYIAARAYLNWFRGENNHLRDTNGEEWLLRLLLPRTEVVFDVGANVGDWAAAALAINPRISLHCFEPASAAFAELQRRGLGPQAVLRQAALSDVAGEAELTVFEGVSAISSIVCAEENSYGHPEGKERVPTLRFDDYLGTAGLGRVGLVKLDVEGAEMMVLRGMERSLRQGLVDAVQFEYGRFSIYGRVFLRDYLGFFGERGFDCYKLVQERLHSFERYQDGLETFEYQNWVAVRRLGPLSALARSHSSAGVLEVK